MWFHKCQQLGLLRIDLQTITPQIKVKKSLYRPREFQEVKVPRFLGNGIGWW
jgi:hypothetical protein